jgi:RarD protein
MRKGILAGITAYTLWGVFPVYWKLLEAVPALEILAHRMIWSLIFVAGVLVLRGDLRWIREALRRRRLVGTYLLAAVLLSLNWFTYIWAVNHDFIVESSLGYFITPLVNMLFGVVFLKERLRPQQAMAVGLAVIGVLYLTVNYGSLPWIALALAVTFSLYGLIKKTAPLSSMHGFTLETLAMFLPALAYLTGSGRQRGIWASGDADDAAAGAGRASDRYPAAAVRGCSAAHPALDARLLAIYFPHAAILAGSGGIPRAIPAGAAGGIRHHLDGTGGIHGGGGDGAEEKDWRIKKLPGAENLAGRLIRRKKEPF